jgi:uncharacterized membrane protein
MMWLGLFMGVVLGALWHGFNTAVVLGFIGWLVGLIAGSMRKKDEPLADRVHRLEQRIEKLETRLKRFESPAAVAPEAQPAPAAVPPTLEPTTGPLIEPAATPKPEPTPAKPNPIVAWLTGGNTIARVGLVILFLGLAFLLKWAVDHAVVPPELRVGGVALVGVALLVFGWRLRERRSGYALGLQGGGVAVLYLTTFAALRLYGLLPPTLAFALLAGIAVFSAALAVMQDALVLAAFGAGGGFLAPVLASTGEGSHVMLFAYYLLLNLGIVGVAMFRSWRSLNIMGFLFTFVIGTAWGMRFYSPEYFDSTEPFLVAFFLLYVAVAVIHAFRMAPARRAYLDGILVFGVPIAAFSLQAALVREIEYGLAFSCVAASALYLALAAALRRRENVRMLFECFLALAVVFFTLAVPLALDARWTSAIWALEGAAVAWIGLRQQRRVASAFGLLMQLLAGGAFLLAYSSLPPGVPWLDAAFLGAMLLALAGLWTSRLVDRSAWKPSFAAIPAIAFLWGFAWLLVAAHHDIRVQVPYSRWPQAWVGLYAVLAVAFLAMSRRLAWKHAAWPSLALVPVLLLLALATMERNAHPFEAFGALAWALAAVAHFWCVRRHEEVAPRGWLTVEHVGGALVLVTMCALELHYWAALETARHGAWSIASVIVPPALALLLVSARFMDARWPVTTHAAAYRLHFAGVLAAAFAIWAFLANVTHDGRSDPLPYMPFVNALDLAHVLAGLAVFSAVLAARRSGLAPTRDIRRLGPFLAAALAFFWLNGVLLRTLHHWAAIPYRIEPMMRSTLVQASLSIFWSVLALALMLFAARRGRRGLWVAGAALMAVVVAKLFVVELSHVGGVERIVSFIVVGLLMLAVGWVAPVPPRTKEAAP